MVSRFLHALLLTLATYTCLMLSTQPSRAFTLELSKNFPSELRTCFEHGISELLTTDRNNEAALRKLFYRQIDRNLLGGRSFGGRDWKLASDTWQEAALEQYFNLVFGHGSALAASFNPDKAVIKARQANKPEVHKKNQWHIVVSVQQGNANLLVAVLITKNCRVFDFAQGPWASTVMDADMVDRVVPAAKRKRS